MINAIHPDIDIMNIVNMRTILNHSRSTFSHTSRYNESTHYPTQSMDASDYKVTISDYPEFTYHLRHVSLSLNYEDLKFNLSYYGQIEQLQEIENLPFT